MAFDTEEVGEQLRNKISSKFQITGTLAGLCFTTLSIQLTLLYQSDVPRLLPQSIALMFAALSLFCLSLYRLDGLTMPKRFWKRPENVVPPPGDDSWSLTDQNLWALHNRMLFIWMRLSVVAIVLTGTALTLLVVPLEKWVHADPVNQTFWWTLGCVGITAVYCAQLRRWESKKEETDKDFGKFLRFCD